MQNIKHSIQTIGIDNQKAFLVSIETVIKKGLFQFEIIGLANKTISESKQRILSALDHTLPLKRQYIHKKITTLLSPAGIKKEGSHFDLPIAISYIISETKTDILWLLFSRTIVLGELTLTGSILPVDNVHKIIEAGIREGFNYFILPKGSKYDFIQQTIYVWKVENISEIVLMLENKKNASKSSSTITKGVTESVAESSADLDTFKSTYFTQYPKKDSAEGKKNTEQLNPILEEKRLVFMIDSITDNNFLKRALAIALAGKHNLLISGEPGSGKSVVAKSARELLPYVEIKDFNTIQIEHITRLNPSMRIRPSDRVEAPFREPHHTSSYSDIIGNNTNPGEILLAHRGILFMDEFSEINKRVIEGLRQPLEDKYLQRNQHGIIDSDFILIGCMNPCDCGFYKSANKRCICAKNQVDRFQRKINSPLFQRFDVFADLNNKQFSLQYLDETLKGLKIFSDIVRVRDIQTRRWKSFSQTLQSNSKAEQDIRTSRSILISIDTHNETLLDESGKRILQDVTQRFYFSKREISSLLRVSRTIADLAGETNIKEIHILEALNFKRKSE